MKISFPQKLFPSPPKNNIDDGKNISHKSKILFCGIARNVERTLQKNIDRMQFLGCYFKEYKIFVYENDSKDATRQILQNADINYQSEHREDSNYWEDIRSGKVNSHLHRCESLAKCRNKYLEYARNYAQDYDYICILDLDTKGWSYKGFFDSINRLHKTDNIGCVSAYGILSDFQNKYTLEETVNSLLMYDSFAFRLENQEVMSNTIQAYFNQLKFNEPTFVKSNFGGMAIYKMPVIIDHSYSAKLTNNFVDCDHVCINEAILNNNWKHILNPYMIVSYSKHRFDYD